MTERETRDASTFLPTTHIQHTSQCVQHTHLCVQRITPRQDNTQNKLHTRLVPFWTPSSQHSQETLNVFVRDGRRRLQTKTCVRKGISEKSKDIQKCILKSVINPVATKNQNSRRIDIGSLKSVKMVTNSGFKLIQQSSIISVNQNNQ